METIKGKVIAAIEKNLGPDFQVKIGAMSTYHITGASLEDVVIQRVAEGKEEPALRAERVRARVGIFSMIFGRPKVSYDAKIGKARISGYVQKSEETYKIQVAFRDIDLGNIPYVQLTTGLHFISSMNGKINVDYDVKQPLKTEGSVEINFDPLSLKKSTVPLGEMGTFPLPDLDLAGSGSSIQGKISRGSMQVDMLKLKAQDFDLDVKGRLFLASQVSMVRVNLQGTFEFSPKLWGVLDPILPEAWTSELKKQKGQGTSYPLSISGQLNSPQVYSGTLRLYPFKPF